MRRLLGLYFGEAHKGAYKSLKTVKKSKARKVGLFFNLFQYSLLSVVTQAFRLIGVARVLHYVKSGYFFRNGTVNRNPFQQCFIGDIIQLNLFSLFIEPWGANSKLGSIKYYEFLKIKNKTF
jgi:hypothetical protein